MYQNGKNITFTDRSNSSVDMFLKDIKKSQPLTNEQEYDLWTLMRQGNKRARDKFIKANLRYVVTVAKKYLASGTALEDLIMAGSLGITKAADMFDATLGYRFISFATWYVESEVRKAAYDHLKHKCDTVSLDEPMYPDKDDSDAMIDYLPSSMEVAADCDYLSMMEKGLTTFDFARKYRLNDQQMRRFLDMVRTESRHYLKAAA